MAPVRDKYLMNIRSIILTLILKSVEIRMYWQCNYGDNFGFLLISLQETLSEAPGWVRYLSSVIIY